MTHEYAFIHIPKCAGISFLEMIEGPFRDKILFFGHDVIFKEIPKNLKQIIVFRDPIDRFTSAFFYSQRMWQVPFRDPNELIYHLTGSDMHTKKIALDFLRGHPKDRNDEKKIPIVNGTRIQTNYTYHPQTAWVDNPYRVLIFERLQQDIDELGLGLKLPHANDSPRIEFEYDKKSVSYLKKVYKEDFHFYDKCRRQ